MTLKKASSVPPSRSPRVETTLLEIATRVRRTDRIGPIETSRVSVLRNWLLGLS